MGYASAVEATLRHLLDRYHLHVLVAVIVDDAGHELVQRVLRPFQTLGEVLAGKYQGSGYAQIPVSADGAFDNGFKFTILRIFL